MVMMFVRGRWYYPPMEKLADRALRVAFASNDDTDAARGQLAHEAVAGAAGDQHVVAVHRVRPAGKFSLS